MLTPQRRIELGSGLMGTTLLTSSVRMTEKGIVALPVALVTGAPPP
jgi:hypothetical protein